MAAVAGPVVARVMLGSHVTVAFIGMLIAGCAVMALLALAVERRIPGPGQRHRHDGTGAQPGVIPQGAANSCPGSSTSRSSPELKASGGQVIGSTAMPLTRRLACGSESPVKT